MPTTKSRDCPVCRQRRVALAERDGHWLVNCELCGPFEITTDAIETLDQSSAPVPSGPSVSSAVRWAVSPPAILLIDRGLAERLILRRFSAPGRPRAYDSLLFWLARFDDNTFDATLGGWGAIIGSDDTRVEQVIARLARRSLIKKKDRESKTSDQITLTLTNIGLEFRDRLEERRRLRHRRRGVSADSKSSVKHYYVSGLCIEHFRCFGRPQFISFQDSDGSISRWNFLIGENGVGKTSILQAIAALSPRRSRRSEFPDIALSSLEDGNVQFTREDVGAAQMEVLWHTGALGEPLSNPVITGLKGSTGSLDRLHLELSLAADSRSLAWGNNLTYVGNTRGVPQSPLVVGYGATRLTADAVLATSKGQNNLGSLFDQNVALRSPEEWLLTLDYSARFEPDARRYEQVNRAKDVLLRLLPDVKEIEVQPPSQDIDRPWVGFHTSYGVVDYSSLSLGYKTTVAWIIDLASRMVEHYPESRSPLDEPGLVLIDEIDLHLHPRWQRLITSQLEAAFPNVQFVATTHSPLTIQGPLEANLILLRNDGNEVCVVNDLDEVRNWRIDQILTSELFDIPSSRPDFVSRLNKRMIEIQSQSTITEADREELVMIEDALRGYGVLSAIGMTEQARALVENLKV